MTIARDESIQENSPRLSSTEHSRRYDRIETPFEELMNSNAAHIDEEAINMAINHAFERTSEMTGIPEQNLASGATTYRLDEVVRATPSFDSSWATVRTRSPFEEIFEDKDILLGYIKSAIRKGLITTQDILILFKDIKDGK